MAAVFGAGLLVLAAVILIGLLQARAGLRTWVALLVAPWYLVWKAVVQLRALASVLRRDDYYPPTARTLTPSHPRDVRLARPDHGTPRSAAGGYSARRHSGVRAPAALL